MALYQAQLSRDGGVLNESNSLTPPDGQDGRTQQGK